jgi:hypothetical protein
MDNCVKLPIPVRDDLNPDLLVIIVRPNGPGVLALDLKIDTAILLIQNGLVPVLSTGNTTGKYTRSQYTDQKILHEIRHVGPFNVALSAAARNGRGPQTHILETVHPQCKQSDPGLTPMESENSKPR